MSLRLRSHRRFAWFALGVFLCGWMLPFFEAHPLGFEDDAACQIEVSSAFAPDGATAGQAARLKNAGPTEPAPAHCVLCHLMRALSGSDTADVARLSAPAAAHVASALADDPVLSLARSASSPRGPPALLLI